jgi:hypothetical protein
MALDDTTSTALANEARRQTAKLAIADLQGRVSNASSLMTIISSTLTDANASLTTKQAELTSIEAGAGSGVTDDWGDRATFITAFIAKAKTAGLITDATLASFQALI